MSALDVLLVILLTTGLGLSLPIWWWLFVGPLVRLSKRLGRRSGHYLHHLKPEHSRR